ncbi:universal stress protein [Opitutus sp. ER46]|uniref:universal stress protein n=1 Tax=Opitutus sp. ER46 TaxID=2161864 RepID=UPI000D30D6D9|nr:universal stress protein [Opitutus sp. ER46]PTY00369.1 universal stress protein [Opitutus sp. ER46]
MKTIVAAVDFSGITDKVVAEAAQLAKTQAGRVVLLAVVQPPIVATEYAPFVENLADIAVAAEKSTERRLNELKAKLEADQVPCETVQHSGPPVHHILEEAKKRAADYIVMGSHGHTALYDLLVGSTTHGVLLRAPCAVIVVPSSRRTGRDRT